MEETEFNGLSMQRVTKTDFDGIKKFLLTDFLYNEPLNRSVNLSAEDSDELFNELVDVGIASSLSYILQTPDGKIVALRLASILDRPAEEHPSEHIDESTWNKIGAKNNNDRMAKKTKRLSPKAQIIANILQELESKACEFIWILINPRLKRLLLWSVISVHKDYTRSGLAKKLLCYKLHEAKQMGCQGCISEASSFKSQLLFKKLGYETIHELKHGDWLDDRGQQIFQCDDSTNSIHLVFKLL
ncbi:unnamed protein product [Onchocerca flexuosa]|uniref:aralkylamine N-acetyltransferase n=1 Tax=Onchocerca flexuosa TaxID=387005 RepID=A0A183H0Y3_9BILA|nr:unnamed protein product [Onchocerca flexuosa]